MPVPLLRGKWKWPLSRCLPRCSGLACVADGVWSKGCRGNHPGGHLFISPLCPLGIRPLSSGAWGKHRRARLLRRPWNPRGLLFNDANVPALPCLSPEFLVWYRYLSNQGKFDRSGSAESACSPDELSGRVYGLEVDSDPSDFPFGLIFGHIERDSQPPKNIAPTPIQERTGTPRAPGLHSG